MKRGFLGVSIAASIALPCAGTLAQEPASPGRTIYVDAFNRGLPFGSPEWLNAMQRSAATGYTAAIEEIGEYYYFRNDESAAIPYFARASDQRDCVATWYLARINFHRGNKERAIARLKQSSQQGCTQADFELGVSYHLGNSGFPLSPSQARYYYDRAIRGRNAGEACLNPGRPADAEHKSCRQSASENLNILENGTTNGDLANSNGTDADAAYQAHQAHEAEINRNVEDANRAYEAATQQIDPH
jgi:TPR repeat protein